LGCIVIVVARTAAISVAGAETTAFFVIVAQCDCVANALAALSISRAMFFALFTGSGQVASPVGFFAFLRLFHFVLNDDVRINLNGINYAMKQQQVAEDNQNSLSRLCCGDGCSEDLIPDN
jgi:hypothetical protein